MGPSEPKLDSYLPKLQAVLSYALAQNPVELSVIRALKLKIRALEKTPKTPKPLNIKTIGSM